jgi:hypothetical protein
VILLRYAIDHEAAQVLSYEAADIQEFPSYFEALDNGGVRGVVRKGGGEKAREAGARVGAEVEGLFTLKVRLAALVRM